MSQLTDRLERDLGEVATGADPSPSAWESISARLGEEAVSEVVLLPEPSPGRSQRRAWIAAVAATIVLVAGAIVVLASAGGDDSTGPVDTGPTTTFESPRNGYSVDLPEGSTITPATQLYGFGSELADEGDDVGVDVVETGSGTVFKGASMAFEEWDLIDARIDERIDEYDALPGSCGVPHGQQAEYTIDGQPGRIAACPGRVDATVVVPGRLYLFSLLDDGPDARADFDALAASIRLTPQTAVDYPALTTTFVSPTYGYSMGFFDRGGLAPATERWDPLPQGTDDRTIDGRFDGVETGLLAYFGAASTEIPPGVSIDAWVDSIDLAPEPSLTDSVWERCFVPRGQQEEITIDGRPGRFLDCGQLAATVVAGGRLYLFILLRSGNDARPYFDSGMDTIELTPETATVA
jgi:hypothetical protein